MESSTSPEWYKSLFLSSLIRLNYFTSLLLREILLNRRFQSKLWSSSSFSTELLVRRDIYAQRKSGQRGVRCLAHNSNWTDAIELIRQLLPIASIYIDKVCRKYCRVLPLERFNYSCAPIILNNVPVIYHAVTVQFLENNVFFLQILICLKHLINQSLLSAYSESLSIRIFLLLFTSITN